MFNLEIPLEELGNDTVRLFIARAYPAMGQAGLYCTSYSVVVREFKDGYNTVKHEVYVDFNKVERHKYPRKGKKAEQEVIEYTKRHLPSMLRQACNQYHIVLQPKASAGVEKFTRSQFTNYKLDQDVEDPEINQIVQGIVEALEFCKDHDPEDEEPLVVSTNTYKKAAIVAKYFCNQLQDWSQMSPLLDTGYELAQFGRDIYFSVVGHGVGFIDRDEIKNNKEMVDDLYFISKLFHFEVEKGDDGEIHLRVSHKKHEIRLLGEKH